MWQMNQGAIYIGVALHILSWPAQSSAAWPVHGDAKWLEALRDAQEVNSQAFPHGRLVAKVREVSPTIIVGRGTTKPPAPKRGEFGGHIVVEWDGVRTYTEQVFGEIVRGSPDVQRPLTIERIVAPEFVWSYSPTKRRAVRNPPDFEMASRLVKVRPNECWFQDVLMAIPWSTFFNPGSPELAAGASKVWTVTQPNADLIQVSIDFDGGRKTEIIASLAKGGNVVSCRHVPAGRADRTQRNANPWQESKWEWREDDKGRWYLTHLHAYFSPYGVQDDAAEYELEVVDFDADYLPPAERFTRDSLQIPDGTAVTEWEGGNRKRDYVLGQPQRNPKALQETLDGLVESLKSTGFASPRARE